MLIVITQFSGPVLVPGSGLERRGREVSVEPSGLDPELQRRLGPRPSRPFLRASLPSLGRKPRSRSGSEIVEKSRQTGKVRAEMP